MQLGHLRLDVVSDGRCRFDGGVMFGVVPRALWSRRARPDRRNRLSFGLNCLLLRGERRTILVDTGIGPKEPPRIREQFGLRASRLVRDLRRHDVRPADVDTVVLTHLHWDHVGGATHLDRAGVAVPTFPNATYLAQRATWEEATAANERNAAGYHEDDFLPLLERGAVRLLDGDESIAPGVDCRVTGGHAPGHQVVTVAGGGRTVLFLGDLVPSHLHLSLAYVSAYDEFPLDSLERKRGLLEEAAREGWVVIFQHDLGEVAGYVERGPRGYALRPLALPEEHDAGFLDTPKSERLE